MLMLLNRTIDSSIASLQLEDVAAEIEYLAMPVASWAGWLHWLPVHPHLDHHPPHRQSHHT